MEEKGLKLCGYVTMPNHLHLIVYYESEDHTLNKIIGESKRFLAYEIVKRLKKKGKKYLLDVLKQGVQSNERAKGKIHQVFRLSFDAKSLGEKDVEEVLDYIHRNPVSGVWRLVDDYTEYTYSSAGYYEAGLRSFYKLHDFRKVSESSPSDSE